MTDTPSPEQRAREALDDATEATTDAVDAAADATERRLDGARDAATGQVRDAAASAEQAVHDVRDRATSAVRRAEASLRRGVAAVSDEDGELRGLSEPTPAKDADEAVEQAAALRRAIDRDLDALQARLPPGEELADKARQLGGAVLAVAGVAAAATLASKQRSERKRIEREAQAHAAAIARYLPQARATPIDDEDEGGGAGKVLLLLAVLGAIVGFVLSRRDDAGGEPDIWGPAS